MRTALLAAAVALFVVTTIAFAAGHIDWPVMLIGVTLAVLAGLLAETYRRHEP